LKYHLIPNNVAIMVSVTNRESTRIFVQQSGLQWFRNCMGSI